MALDGNLLLVDLWRLRHAKRERLEYLDNNVAVGAIDEAHAAGEQRALRLEIAQLRARQAPRHTRYVREGRRTG
jgi:hypothetical protein